MKGRKQATMVRVLTTGDAEGGKVEGGGGVGEGVGGKQAARHS